MPQRKPQPQRSPVSGDTDTKALLVRAALDEFCLHGYAGTDTNKIARRAGFAPQTFYRWFKDKTEVFVAAYREWEEQELAVLAALAAKRAVPEKIAEAVIQHHRDHLLFRRSLRQLSVENPDVRQARTASRKRQIDRLRAANGVPMEHASSLFILLLQAERLADAAAEGELQDLGIADSLLADAIADIIQRMKHSV